MVKTSPMTLWSSVGDEGALTPPFFGETSPQTHHYSLRSTQDTQAKAFHCAVNSKMSGLTVTGYRVLASGRSNGAFRQRKWQQQQWGRKKDYSCFCDHFCPSKLWGLALAPLAVDVKRQHK
ncbi:hypothetical protein DVH24_036378 [Malus domestica]|uniref:Uncharacterized protein n=1 Tax=Malus domestica TaxID=3750 RepID=A0A498IIZ8_MALDO|nr:hypothetical protein DVH24_036378 [Malus domestica]